MLSLGMDKIELSPGIYLLSPGMDKILLSLGMNKISLAPGNIAFTGNRG
jgi:hypothetical protein